MCAVDSNPRGMQIAQQQGLPRLAEKVSVTDYLAGAGTNVPAPRLSVTQISRAG